MIDKNEARLINTRPGLNKNLLASNTKINTLNQLPVLIEYNSVKISKQNSKNYWGIYPTLNLMYNINEQKGNSISLFYQKAMDPIPYSAITPVVIYNNEYLYTKYLFFYINGFYYTDMERYSIIWINNT